MYYLSFLFSLFIILLSQNLYAGDLASDAKTNDLQETTQYCKSVQDNALAILANYDDKNFSTELIEYSNSYPIDNDCYRWQLVILNNLRKLSLEPIGYREYMFERVRSSNEGFRSELMLHVFRYSLEGKPLSIQEWQTVKASLAVSNELAVISVMLGLVTASKDNNIELEEKMASLFEMAKDNNLAAPELVDLSKAIELFLTITIEHRPDLFSNYYERYFYLLDENGVNNITLEAVNFFNNNQNEIGLKFIETFIGNVVADSDVNKSLFSLLYKIHKEKISSEFYNHVVTVLVENHPEKIRHIISKANLNDMKKDLLILEYQLDKPGEYSVATYSQQLFDKKIRQQQKAAAYLLALGPRSIVAKNEVVAKLESIKVSKEKIASTNLIISLVKVLDNINAQDQQSINILLWALEDSDPRISQQAKMTLQSIGAVAMPEYNRNFKSYSVKKQALVIEIMGGFDSGKLTAIKFLSRVKPKNEKMKFAIDDAVAELNAF